MIWTDTTSRVSILVASILIAVSAFAQAPTDPAKAQPKSLDEAIKVIAKYRTGDDSKALVWLQDRVMATHGDVAARKEIETQLITLIHSGATTEGKQFAAKQLEMIASDASVQTLLGLLLSPADSDSARLVLQSMPGAQIDKGMIAALPQAPKTIKLGLIASLGERGAQASVFALVPLLASKDLDIATATADALGRIGGSEATHALGKVTRPDLRVASASALLKCAKRVLDRGDAKGAADLYQKAFQSYASPAIRNAALQGLALSQGEAALPIVITSLSGGDQKTEAAAAMALQSIKGAAATQALVKAIPELAPRAQALAIDTLAARGDSTGVNAALAAASESPDPGVQLASAHALGKIGGATSVRHLATLASKSQGDLRLAARRSLVALRGNDIDAAIIAALPQTSGTERVELIQALGDRRAQNAGPALLAAATDRDAIVRTQAYQSLAPLASESDVQVLLGRLIVETDDTARVAAEKAVVTAVRKVGDPATQSKTVIAAFSKAKRNPAAHCALIHVLGNIDSPASVKKLTTDAKSRDPQVAAAAAKSLSEWANAGPAPTLIRLAARTKDAGLKTTLLRGYLRMMELPNERDSVEFTSAYEAVFKIADSLELKKIVLASLGNQHREEAKELALKYVSDADVQNEAKTVADKLASSSLHVTASNAPNDAPQAVDGDINTRWTSGESQHGGEWFEVDLGGPRNVESLVLDSTPSAGDYPRGYEVYVSNDEKNWGKPVAAGAGTSAKVEITFKPAKGRYIRIVQTGKIDGLFWSIHELSIGFAR